MTAVMTEYEKLQSAIDDLGSAIDGTLGRQREDLQRTHKTETRRVQVEVETLSKEKARLEESIATNDRANQLETQRDWYKKEALHQEQCNQEMTARQTDLANKLDESEQDRTLLHERVEKLLCRNVTLERRSVALEKKLEALGVDVGTVPSV